MRRPRSLWIYDALLRIYPATFREAYASELRWVFQHQLEDARKRAGALGIARTWAEAVPDLIVSAADQHAQEDFKMARLALSRAASIAGIVGGALWVAGGVMLLMRPPGVDGLFRASEDVIVLFVIGAVCFAAGLIAVFAGPGRGWPTLARLLLLIPAACAVYTLVIWLIPISDNWMVRIAGMVMAMAAVTLAGVVLLVRPETRGWGLLLTTQGVTELLFNTEDWRALFLSLSGLIIILVMSQLFQPDTGPRSQAPAVS